jgi:hypothetical protein
MGPENGGGQFRGFSGFFGKFADKKYFGIPLAKDRLL